MNSESESRKRPSLTSLVAFFLIILPVLYVLSYGPAVRWKQASEYEAMESSPFYPPPAPDMSMPFYKPVEWLIDETVLRTPLSWWVGVWTERSDDEFTAAPTHGFPVF